jgi:hypothetical protein
MVPEDESIPSPVDTHELKILRSDFGLVIEIFLHIVVANHPNDLCILERYHQ